MQFTPDLLPADVTGGMVFNQRDVTFDFHRGPIFANVVLADEINRASPKPQSALLQVMEEAQVTVDGQTHDVPRPLIVIATQMGMSTCFGPGVLSTAAPSGSQPDQKSTPTQNPIEQEGTYRLPEAAICDRGAQHGPASAIFR